MNLKDFATGTAVFNDMRQLIVCMEKLVVISDTWNPGNAFWRGGHSAFGYNHRGPGDFAEYSSLSTPYFFCRFIAGQRNRWGNGVAALEGLGKNLSSHIY